MFAVFLLFAICFASPADTNRQLRKSNKALLEALKTLTEAESAVGEPTYCAKSLCSIPYYKTSCTDTCGEPKPVDCSTLLTCTECVGSEGQDADGKRVCDYKKQPGGNYKCVDAAGTKWNEMEVRDMYSCPKCDNMMEPLSYEDGIFERDGKATPQLGCQNWCFNFETGKMRWNTDCFADFKPYGSQVLEEVWGKCGPGAQCTTKPVKKDCSEHEENQEYKHYCP